MGLVLVFLSAVANPPYRVIYNATASAPIGWYVVYPTTSLSVGTLVLLWLPPDARVLAGERHYLPTSVPALKRIVAAAGDNVCEKGGIVAINERAVARAKPFDGLGRELVAWHGCRTLSSKKIFVLNTDTDASFDGRYFGPIDSDTVIGAAHPIWRW